MKAARRGAASTENALHDTTSVDPQAQYRALVFPDRQAAVELTAKGVPATFYDALTSATAEQIAAYLDGAPAVFVRDPLPGYSLEEQAAMEAVLQAGGRVKVVRP